MSLADYLRLLDWAGRQLRRDKRSAIPSDLSGILERLQISEAGWIDLVKDFARLFHRAAGRPASLAREARLRTGGTVESLSCVPLALPVPCGTLPR